MPVYLNAAPLEERVARAGLSMAEFALIAGVSEVTISNAKHGRPVRPRTLRQLAIGLSRLREIPALQELVTASKPDQLRKQKNGHAGLNSLVAREGDRDIATSSQ